MPDREKVIELLNKALTRVGRGDMDNVILSEVEEAIESAIALLREQEAVEPYDSPPGYYRCGNCGTHVYKYGEQGKYCPRCGRKVKWG